MLDFILFIFTFSCLLYLTWPLRARFYNDRLIKGSYRLHSKISNDIDPIIEILDDRTRTKELIDAVMSSKRSYAEILIERFGQTIDDFQLSSKIKSLTKLIENDPMAKEGITKRKRERIVILGTGWAGYSLCKSLDSEMYEVIVVSPRNYFLFTPMLAASSVGTVEFKSICDPIRNVNPFVDYLEATAAEVFVSNSTVRCEAIRCEGTSCEPLEFDITYDYLVISVGAVTNTFGIKGVRDHCLFLKQIDDASNIRRAIISCFERANVRGLSEDEIRTALSFVIVGAGPTGVEFTGELRDWVEVEGRKYYGNLLKYVKIYLIEAGNAILPVFDEALRNEALKMLTERETKLIQDGLIKREITSVIVRAGVKEVQDKFLLLSSGETLQYGFCVWAAGNGCLPFIQNFVDSIEIQKSLQSVARGKVVTDRWLKVLGTNNIFSLGDCAYIQENSLPATAQVASQGGAYLGRLFSKRYFMKVPAMFPPIKYDEESEDSSMKYFSERLKIGSLGMTPSALEMESFLNATNLEIAKPFQFLNLGVLAYIGASKALAQINVDDKLVMESGTLGFLLWRGIYWFKQVSWRNRFLVGIDWLRSRVFGRDIGAF